MANVADSIKIFTLLLTWVAVPINHEIFLVINGMNSKKKNIIGILSAADMLPCSVQYPLAKSL